jgi:hypothetical protein
MKYQPPFVYGATPGAPGIFNADPNASYVNGDPALGIEGSYFPGQSIEHAQREIVAALASSGITPDHLVLTQLSEAMARYASGGVFGIDSGAVNAMVVSAALTFTPPKALFRGMRVIVRPAVTNTGAATANAFTLGVKSVLRYDGSALVAGDLVSGRAVDMEYDPTAAAGAGAYLLMPWSVLASSASASATMPIFPEITASNNVLACTLSAGQIIVDTGQSWTHRGSATYTTTSFSLANRTFATVASKTYHLRWYAPGHANAPSGTWPSGRFMLRDLADGTYNPSTLAEDNIFFDTTYDDMLIGRVVTSAGNVLTLTALMNKSFLSTKASVVNGGNASFQNDTDPDAMTNTGVDITTITWSRIPRVALRAANDFTVYETTQSTLAEVNLGARAISRYVIWTWGQRTGGTIGGYFIAYGAEA